MGQYQGVFKRYEEKYLLTEKQYRIFTEKLKTYMNADQYGLHPICNIYYDTEDFALIRASIEKPVYKEKLRLRSYGVPTAESEVFIELKKKYKGVVYKRREQMTLSKAADYLSGRGPRERQSQILSEIDWFMQMYNPVPKAFIAYDRMALYGRDDPTLRVTFDANIRCRDYDLELSKGSYGERILEPDRYLMEIKLAYAMPLWLAHMLDAHGVYPVSFSKYGKCYELYLTAKKTGGIECA